MKSFTWTTLSLAFFTAFVSLDASACRCARAPVDQQIAAADAILSGEVLWAGENGPNNQAIVLFTKVLKLSNDVGTAARAELATFLEEGRAAFFNGFSASQTSCPGTSVVRPVGTKVIYVAKRGSDGLFSFKDISIGTCAVNYTFVTSDSTQFYDLAVILDPGSLATFR